MFMLCEENQEGIYTLRGEDLQVVHQLDTNDLEIQKLGGDYAAVEKFFSNWCTEQGWFRN